MGEGYESIAELERLLDLERSNHCREHEAHLKEIQRSNELAKEVAILRARINTLEADKGWLREQMTRPRP